MMNEMFPLMQTLITPRRRPPRECQDLMGMSFRTFHFDGAVRVPSYLAWLMDCDMRETYAFHRRVLKLLQWHCPPTLWHLKTPVHMFALDALVEAYPDARFLWSHRDPAKVMGSVCSLIRYAAVGAATATTRGTRCGTAGQLGRGCSSGHGLPQTCWWRALLRRRIRGSTVGPGQQLEGGLRVFGLGVLRAAAGSVAQWAAEHKPGTRGAHDYELADFGLTSEGVRERFAEYLDTYDATA